MYRNHDPIGQVRRRLGDRAVVRCVKDARRIDPYKDCPKCESYSRSDLYHEFCRMKRDLAKIYSR
jgi:hypothetical protein